MARVAPLVQDRNIEVRKQAVRALDQVLRTIEPAALLAYALNADSPQRVRSQVLKRSLSCGYRN